MPTFGWEGRTRTGEVRKGVLEADNDAELFSAGLILVDAAETQWRALIRFGELNADGVPDSRNTLTASAFRFENCSAARSNRPS